LVSKLAGAAIWGLLERELGITMRPPNRTTSPTILESIRAVATDLLVGDDAPPRIAEVAVQRFEELARHLAQLVGEMGVRALFARTVADARSTYPWLAATSPIDPWVSLRGAMERQDPRTIRDAFVGLLSTFVELLARLIGDELVKRLLHDVWPEVFPQVPKETT
jgi:hypothetical protein